MSFHVLVCRLLGSIAPFSYLCRSSSSPQILHRIRSTLQHSLVQGHSVFNSFVRRSHFLPDQLPGEHTGDMSAVSTFLLQRDNLGKCKMFLHLHVKTISDRLGSFRQFMYYSLVTSPSVVFPYLSSYSGLCQNPLFSNFA